MHPCDAALCKDLARRGTQFGEIDAPGLEAAAADVQRPRHFTLS